MKLLAIAMMASAVLGNKTMDKCHKLPKGGSRRYTTPRSIERGNDQPGSINFLIDNRSTLLNVFGRGAKDSNQLNKLIDANMHMLSTFTSAVDDIYMGQIFREARQKFVNVVSDGQTLANKMSTEFGQLYRDNTQRSMKALRDITYNKDILDKVAANTEFMVDLQNFVNLDDSEGSEVYRNFVNAHGREFIPHIKAALPALEKTRTAIKSALYKVLIDEQLKSSYRQLVNELPLVYQFFNDNIDFIMMANMEKSLDEAVAKDIMEVLAKDADPQVHSMIVRNMKFIKKLMTERAEKQMKEKAVAKVMEKNAELKAAAENEAEFNKILEEKKKNKEQLTKEMKNKIWEQVVAKNKAKQQEDLGNQLEKKDDTKNKPATGLSRYEHLAGIIALLPDELLQTVSEMVKKSCPEMDLTQVDDADMKHIIESQPDNFLDQLLQELHDVCDMFGLIDETKIIRKVVNGVEIEIYAADWMQGKKVEW